MNIAIIFAGRSGTRMHVKDRPKQFLLVHGKPIIVHTIETFQNHPQIDGIIVVCIQDWIPYMEEMKYRYRLEKIISIVPGGNTGQLSIYNGLLEAKERCGTSETIVLIHDGVRPLIDADTISRNIKCVKENGVAITCSEVRETVVLIADNNSVADIPARQNSRIAKAPQSFWLKDILQIHQKALADGITNSIDSCTLMMHYNQKMTIVNGSSDNIKITTPDDFYTFRALYDARENAQLEPSL